jgi:hypothetical protein
VLAPIPENRKMKSRKSTRESSWTNSNAATQLAGQETPNLEAPSPDSKLRRGKEKNNSRSTHIRQQSTAPRKIFHSASKQKSFSHVAKTETKNRRRLRNSIGGETNRRCEKGNHGNDTNENAPKSEHERKLNGSQTSTECESKNTTKNSDLMTQEGTIKCNEGFSIEAQ